MKSRQAVWTDSAVLELAKEFVLAADEVYALQTKKDQEGLLFQKIAEQGHYAGRTVPSSTRQGTYVLAPSGVFLASVNTNSPKDMAAMMRKALEKWRSLPRDERLPQQSASDDTISRQEQMYPEDGLVLRVNCKDLPRVNQKEGWRASAWNQDFAWFRKSEVHSMLPQKLEVGSEQEMPRQLAYRLSRLHLVDRVRGQSEGFPMEAVQEAAITVRVERVSGHDVRIVFTGRAHLKQEGEWWVSGSAGPDKPKGTERGFKADLYGRATYDQRSQKFVRFELVALGSRWGGTQYNARGDDMEPAPMGVALTLAGESPAERVPPASFSAYGWR